ncbi:MAG: type IV pilus twitching motility protein PilT [Candidatus Xenobia bacterium]
MAIIDSYLEYLLQMGASDFIMPSGGRPMMRVHGELCVMKRSVLNPTDVQYHANEVLGAENMGQLPALKSMSFVYEATIAGQARRFRGHIYYQRNGLNITMRAMPPVPPHLESLRLPPSLAQLVDVGDGLVIVSSPVGHGRSSTVAALTRRVLEQRRGHVVSLEDPIEVVHPPATSFISQRQVGLHVPSFAAGVSAALREDADVLVLSDVPDGDTAWLVMRAADAGLLVIAGLAAPGVEGVMQRWMDLFPDDQHAVMRNLANRTLRAVISQRLQMRADGKGREPRVEILRASAAKEARPAIELV